MFLNSYSMDKEKKDKENLKFTLLTYFSFIAQPLFNSLSKAFYMITLKESVGYI